MVSLLFDVFVLTGNSVSLLSLIDILVQAGTDSAAAGGSNVSSKGIDLRNTSVDLPCSSQHIGLAVVIIRSCRD